jgi:hypothetical protein
MPGSAGEAPAVSRASRDTHGELFGEGAENSGEAPALPTTNLLSKTAVFC